MEGHKLIFDAQPSMRTFDANGYMHVAMTPISKACVNPYLGREIPGWEEQGLEPEQIYYGLRDPDELAKAVKTFNGLPLLMNHHEIDAEIQPKEYIVGSTGTDATFDKPYLKNSLSITDADAIAAVEDGTAKEISCAYFFTPDFTEGEFVDDGGDKVHYDFIMRDIRGNHVALVAEGRAGHDVKVVDAMPQDIKQRSEKSVTKKVTTQERITAFKKLRNELAQDAQLKHGSIYSKEFQTALSIMDAQVSGIDPRAIGIAADSKATVDEIIECAMPECDEETKAEYKVVLEKLAEALPEAEDEPLEPEVPEDADPEPVAKVEEPAGDDDFEEKMKDPMFRAGFEAGTRYGEKREKADPQRIDRDHEREGMEKRLGEDSIAKLKEQFAKDTEKARLQAVQDAKKHYRALNAAAEKVVPLIGRIKDPLAFDSAEDIYAFALKNCGKDPDKYDKAAYDGMVDMLLDAKTEYGITQDAMGGGEPLDDETDAAFKYLDNIR